MGHLEKEATELVKRLVPNFEKLDFKATVSDTSRSLEFVVWVNGERKQCYALADSGAIDEATMEKLFAEYADLVRNSTKYKKGEVNRVQCSVDMSVT